jgi:hypothetical protein
MTAAGRPQREAAKNAQNRYQIAGLIAELAELGAAEGSEGLLDDLLPLALSQQHGHHRRHKKEDEDDDDDDFAGGGDVEEGEGLPGYFQWMLANHLQRWAENHRRKVEERKCIEDGECGEERRQIAGHAGAIDTHPKKKRTRATAGLRRSLVDARGLRRKLHPACVSFLGEYQTT